MRLTWREVRAVMVLVGLVATIGASKARAQSSLTGGSRSLGGYGGSMIATGSGMGMSGPVIPYAGNFGGFMPYRMGGGSLSFQSRGTSPMASGRTSFSLSSTSGGMSSMSGGMGQSLGMGSRTFSPLGSQGGLGLGGGMSTMSGGGRMGVMPPSFGNPFREPPSLVAPASSGMGMSM
jgi:hypothetical protein